MGNASSTQKLQHAQQNAAMSSSFGDADSDPIQEFKNTFQQYSANYQMPPITQCSIYQIYSWKKADFAHKSIVVGCSSDQYLKTKNKSKNSDIVEYAWDFITIELYVDFANEILYYYHILFILINQKVNHILKIKNGN